MFLLLQQKLVTDIDIARAYIDTIVTARPVANFFGGDIMEPVFNWLYYTVDWNVNNFGNIFAKGMYSALMIWGLIAFICYFILSKTQAGNWIYSTGGNLNAAKANGVPTNKVKIALFVNTAFCATMFAACQVFEVNTADTAKGNLKELEAIACSGYWRCCSNRRFWNNRWNYLRHNYFWNSKRSLLLYSWN
jgi:simple sugar transport system permease protein